MASSVDGKYAPMVTRSKDGTLYLHTLCPVSSTLRFSHLHAKALLFSFEDYSITAKKFIMDATEVTTHDWHSAKLANRAPLDWAEKTSASRPGKSATKALKGAVAEQEAARGSRERIKMTRLLVRVKHYESDSDTQSDAGQRVPDIDASPHYSPAQKAYIRAEQRALLRNESFDGMYDFVPTNEFNGLESVINEPNDPTPPVSDEVIQRKEKRMLERLDDADAFERLMALPGENAESAWSPWIHQDRREKDAQLREKNQKLFERDEVLRDDKRKPARPTRMDPVGLNLSAVPVLERPIPEAYLSPIEGRGKRRRIATARQAEQG